ncbi:unnamed protein product [Gongylonema pulchrum]|uniref:Uncharacterized protein n=1 Tax=Gongylonema pulchrum TaxID=637853 RepID=A0A183CWM2_9BILA|nr:unnamed protein product [Gongylonema pulchrum]
MYGYPQQPYYTSQPAYGYAYGGQQPPVVMEFVLDSKRRLLEVQVPMRVNAVYGRCWHVAAAAVSPNAVINSFATVLILPQMQLQPYSKMKLRHVMMTLC